MATTNAGVGAAGPSVGATRPVSLASDDPIASRVELPARASPSRRRSEALRLGAGGVLALAVAGVAPAAVPRTGAVPIGSATTCDPVNPTYVAAVFNWPGSDIVLFNDTPQNATSARTVAQGSDLGAIYGLAVDRRRGQVYAAASFDVFRGFGPGGPGGVYRIDAGTGQVALFAALDAGADVGPRDPLDYTLGRFAGKMSLGDVEIDSTMSELFVANLHDGRIHRFAVPDGTYLGAFENGAAGEAWAPNARLMGLGYRNGWLYQGVVDSREHPELPGGFVGYVYRSRDDGSELAEVATFAVDYRHESPWAIWDDSDLRAPPRADHFQPLISDIEFRSDGELILGLRNRLDYRCLAGLPGDALPTRADGPDHWTVVTDPEWYRDNLSADVPEALYGSMAPFPERDLVVAGAFAPTGKWLEYGAVWFDNATGGIDGPADGREPLIDNECRSMGDIELYCPPDDTIPTPTASRTPSPTATFTPVPTGTPTETATAPDTPTPTAISVRPIYLPLAARRACTDQTRFVDVALVIDASTTMRGQTTAGRSKLAAVQEAARTLVGLLRLAPDGRGDHDQVAVVGFNDTAWTAQPLTNNPSLAGAALDALPARVAEGTRLDLALMEGASALALPSRRQGSVPLLILLTDGLPNRVPTPIPAGSQEDTVLARAREAKDRGIRVFTIGVGRPDAPVPAERIDANLLRAVASDPGDFYQSPDAEDLARIYGLIATVFRCPGDR